MDESMVSGDSLLPKPMPKPFLITVYPRFISFIAGPIDRTCLNISPEPLQI